MQIVSDLHLEFYTPNEVLNKVKLKISAPYLALLGDICVAGNTDIKNMEKFLDHYSQYYTKVIWIAGNHEFYTSKKNPISIDDIDGVCRQLCHKYKNVVFLNNEHIDLVINDKIHRIIGTTLWTKIPKDMESFVVGNMNDYRNIFIVDEKNIGPMISAVTKLYPAYVNVMHKKASQYISSQLKSSEYPVIVLTHHKPFITPDARPDIFDVGYQTDQLKRLTLKQKAKIKFWAYGHTHKHFDAIVGGVRFVSNPKGYPGQQTKFENNLVINV